MEVHWLALLTMLPLTALGWAWRGRPVRLLTWALRIVPPVFFIIVSTPASARPLAVCVFLAGVVALMLAAVYRCRQEGDFRGFWRTCDSVLYILLVAPTYYMCAFIGCGILTFCIGFGIGAMKSGDFTRLQPWRRSAISEALPFSVQYRKIHPFLAEYEKRLAFKSGRMVPLWTDTGGAGPFEVYALDAGRYYIVDGLKHEFIRHDYLVDVSNETVSVMWENHWFEIPPGDGVLSGVGGVKGSAECTLTISPHFAVPHERDVSVKGVPVGDTLSKRRYLGLIYTNGRFVPVSRQ